ncbi:MAG: hypothetical protein AABW46_00830 [Nanoarchaeota archaeon]
MTDLVMGPATGWLYSFGINDLAEHARILDDSGANAVEFGLNLWEEDRIRSLQEGEPLRLDYKSIHLPDYSAERDEDLQLRNAMDIVTRHDIKAAVMHPLKISGRYFEKMISGGVPLAIENMDKAKPSGFKLEELLGFMKEYGGLRWVFDVQHAYEHDHSMSYARELFNAMKDRLVHFHVSGYNKEESLHALVYHAVNKDVIVNFLGEIVSSTDAPIILEGRYSTQEDIEREIDFLRKELS